MICSTKILLDQKYSSSRTSFIITRNKELFILQPCLPNWHPFQNIFILYAVAFVNNFYK
ncbi:MAG: hypothetical protein JST21_03615 [Bacteroidetes bacterium]|nr:hypothetical protein [Bacteroidota bacterium]